MTGVSSGIGLACAKQILDAGGRVMGADKDKAVIESEAYEHFQLSVTKLFSFQSGSQKEESSEYSANFMNDDEDGVMQ